MKVQHFKYQNSTLGMIWSQFHPSPMFYIFQVVPSQCMCMLLPFISAVSIYISATCINQVSYKIHHSVFVWFRLFCYTQTLYCSLCCSWHAEKTVIYWKFSQWC